MNRVEKQVEQEPATALTEALFGVKLTKTQEIIVSSILYRRSKRIVISCLTRYGKTFVVAMAVVLFIFCNPKKRVNIVAPTSDQAHILRNYITEFILAHPALTALVDLGATGVEVMRKEVSKSRITFKNGCVLKVLSAEGTGERLMGWGCDLLVVDESCLIKPEVYRTKINRMLGDNPDSMLVEIGNPTKRDSHMFQHWMSDEFLKIHVDWRTALREGRVSLEFLKEQRRNLTPNEWRVLYEALFPLSENDALIKWEWVEEAKRPAEVLKGDYVFGLDVAEAGTDLSVLTAAVRKDGHYFVENAWKWHQADTTKTFASAADIISGYEERAKEKLEKKEDFIRFQVNVDATGVGKGVADMLSAAGFNCQGVKVGMAAQREPERFLSLKSQYWWKTRSLFEDRLIHLGNFGLRETLVEQLLSMRYELTSARKIKIIDPEVKSPDFADSLMLCVSGKEPLIFDF